jgi:predicted exporter/lauroyl/myristoyl acyltransferase
MRSALRRWWWLLLAVPLLAGWWRVRFDTEVLGLLPASVPAVRGLQLYQKHFTNARELVVTLRAPDAESAETAARVLAEALRGETNLASSAVWQPPWLEHPEEMAGFIAYLWLNETPEAFARFTHRLAPERLATVVRETKEQLATSMSPTDIARLSYDPFGFTRLPEGALGSVFLASPQAGFASADGSFRAVFVEASQELPNYRACAKWIAAVQAAATQAAQAPGWPVGVTVRYTGSPAFVAEIASSMAGDMQFTVLTTLALIVALFWWAHRSWRPLGWLVVLLLLIMAGALAAGGLIFGTLNAVSLGFGAILLGLAVDCGLVVYQEAAAEPHRSAADLRRVLVPSVLWSALTTSAAFLLLNFAGLPGLSQLGTIVGIGVLLAPLVMLFLFLPLALRWLREHPPRPLVARTAPPPPGRYRAATLLAAALAALSLWRAWPPVDRSNSSIEPKNCSAQLALNELTANLSQHGEPLLMVIAGRDEPAVADKLNAVERHLAGAQTNGPGFRALLPVAIWPYPDRQRTNALAAAALAARAGVLRASAEEAGFTPGAMELTENVLRAWAEPTPGARGLWPTNQSCRWLLQRTAAWTGEGWLATGAVYPQTNSPTLGRLAEQLDPGLPGVWVTGWPLLGESLARHVERRVLWLVLAIVAVVGLCLRLAFRRWTEVFISFGALGFMLLILQAVLGLAGASWNLMSLAALPLLLGVGVDYIIHVQVALRRHHGDVAAMRRVTGRAILLCAATNVDGFGSNVMSSNPGLASLGLVCAIGITVAYVTAVFLVPAWWQLWGARPAAGAATDDRLARPSAAYGPRLWRLGLLLVRFLPRRLCRTLGLMVALAYRFARPRRFRILEENLLPVMRGNPSAARRAASSLLAKFALKITDLLRHEGGAGNEIPVLQWSGFDILRTALERRRGVVLVTPHLGNWEFGGVLLAQAGVRLLVLTQAEPGRGFTELRQQARARWGIETLVVGQDAFAFVEIIKRLQDGAAVALLVDRPPPNSAVEVEFFGRPFRASIAPAELARASGCALVPVYVVAEGDAYSAHVLPEIAYDRRAIGDREARRELAAKTLRAFEPAIRQHPDQWYHFVPLWQNGPAWPGNPKSK